MLILDGGKQLINRVFFFIHENQEDFIETAETVQTTLNFHLTHAQL